MKYIILSALLILKGCVGIHIGASELPPGCPCAGQLSCECSVEDGSYSFYDGCNTHSCNVNGVCLVTALYCPPPDWRGGVLGWSPKKSDVITLEGTIDWGQAASTMAFGSSNIVYSTSTAPVESFIIGFASNQEPWIKCNQDANECVVYKSKAWLIIDESSITVRMKP